MVPYARRFSDGKSIDFDVLPQQHKIAHKN